MPWTDWVHEEPNFPTCECTDERSSCPDWMAITRGKVAATQDSGQSRSRKRIKGQDGSYRLLPLAVVQYPDGTMEMGTRTFFRHKLVVQNDRIRDAIETGKPMTWHGIKLCLRNATPEEEKAYV